MRERDRKTADHFGILPRIEKLERELLAIDYVADIEFDLDGFWSEIYQVILIPKYDIAVDRNDYWDVRKKMLSQIIDVAMNNHLVRSGDTIEDMGEHYYIVMNCDKTWQ